MLTKGDAVFAKKCVGHTFAGPGFGIEQPQFQPPNLKPVPQQHPQRGVTQIGLQRLEDFIPGIGAVIGGKLVQRLLLGRLEEGPQVVLGDAMRRVRDFSLFQRDIAVIAAQVLRDVCLKGNLRGFLARHDSASQSFIKA